MEKLTVDQALSKAKSHANRGEAAEAQKLYETVLRKFPKNKRAQKGLSSLNKMRKTNTTHALPQDTLDQLLGLYNRGSLASVVEQAQKIITQYPNAHIVWNILGAAAAQTGNADEAIRAFQKVISLKPDYPDGYNNLGNVFKDQGKLDDAISAFQRALTIEPDYAEAHYNMGVALQKQDKPADAISAYHRALEVKPDYAEAHYNMGITLQKQGELDDAISAFQRALEIKPDYSGAYNNMGNALKDRGELDHAIVAYQRALEIKPDSAEVHNNMGGSLQEQGKFDDAISAFQRALEIKPDYAEAYYNIGVALQKQDKPADAIAAYQRAVEIEPDYAEAYYNMGVTLQEQGKPLDAIAAYQRALKVKPDYATAEAQMLHQQQQVCDFTISGGLSEASARLGISTDVVPSFGSLPWVDNPEEQFLRAKAWATEKYKQSPLPLPARPKFQPERLKIGYFSADFHNHACMYLMAGLFESHDRENFEVFAFSYGPHKSDEMRKRISSSVDHFVDIRGAYPAEVGQLTRDKVIDISIHLNGYTKNQRTELFQYRLSPIQINYLGYPGSLGADFIDYIVADPVLIPDTQRQFYSENVIYLPHTYLPNDNTREIAVTNTKRADFGLPEEAFVFCCFNNNYKIGVREFDIWMRLLSKVEGSVLWLAKSNPWAKQNLRKEAGQRGVDPCRLIFAERLPSQSEHLARQKHADLFIDTFNFNAHTTASDALWGGLPVVTKQGKQFAARVAASLLTAVGLPDLITETEEDYENLIFALATQPEKLAGIKARLSDNRMKEPLFDTKRYTRNFEHGLRQAYDLYFDGKQPQDILVEDNTV